MKTLNPYLSFGGNALETKNFYKDVLQGEIVSVQTYSEVIPAAIHAFFNPARQNQGKSPSLEYWLIRV